MAALLRPGILRTCRNLTVYATKNPLGYLRHAQRIPILNTQQLSLPNISAARHFMDSFPSENTTQNVETERSSSTEPDHEAEMIEAEGFPSERNTERRRERGGMGRNHFDRLLKKLGTIATGKSLVKIFDEILERDKEISHLQAYQILRNCGKELIHETPEKRIDLAHFFWDKLQATGVNPDIMLYNVLLSVYLQNNYKFNPLEVLEQIQGASLEPNLTTMALVIQGFGQSGDIGGVYKVLEFMKTADMPVTEPVYTSLIVAYGKTRDMTSAKGVFDIMRENGMEPGIESYTALLTAYAENGNLLSIDETISEMQEKRLYPTQSVYMSLIETFSRCGRHDIIKQILEKPAVKRLVEADLQSQMLVLAGYGEVKGAFALLDFIPQLPVTSFASNPQNLLLKQIIMSRQSTEDILMAVNDLNTRGTMKDVFETALDISYNIKRPETSIAIIKEMFAKKIKVKKHYFYPLLATYADAMDAKGPQDIFTLMAENNLDIDPISLSYCVKSFGQPKDADIDTFLDISKDVSLSPYLLTTMAQLVMEAGNIEKLKNVFDYAEQKVTGERIFPQAFGGAMKRSFDAQNGIEIIKELNSRGFTTLLAFDISDVLEYCCKSQMGCKEGVKFLQLMLSEGLQELMDSRSYTAVMKHLNLHNMHDEFFELIRVMKEHKVPLDEHQYRQMIRMFTFIGETKAAQFCFDSYKKLVEPNSTVYSLLISSYGHSKDGGFFADGMPLKYKNPKRIIELHDEMTKQGLKPDHRARSYVMMSYLTLGKMEEADAVKELYGDIGALTYRVQTGYLKAYADKGDVENVERVMEELRSMENVHLSTFPYSVAIGVYKFHGDIESQRRLLDEMKASGVRANGYTYGEMMRTFLFKDDAEGALGILEEAKANKTYPAVGTCIYLLSVCARTLPPDRVEQVVMDMFADMTQGRTHSSPMILVHAMIFTCVSYDRSDLALRMMEETPNHNPQQYSINAQSAARRGDTDSILKCIRFLEENNLDSTSLLIPLIRAYETTRDPQAALRVYNKYIEEGGEPWSDLQLILANVLRKNGEPVPFKVQRKSDRQRHQYKSDVAEVSEGHRSEELEMRNTDAAKDITNRETSSDL